MGVVLGVSGLVEKSPPVVSAAHRLNHEHDPARNLDWSAERARALRRALLDVELDVLLRAEVDPEVCERDLEGRHHLLGGESLVPARRAEDSRDVPAPGFVESDAGTSPEQLVRRALVELLRRVEDGAALVGELVELEPETPIEVSIGR